METSIHSDLSRWGTHWLLFRRLVLQGDATIKLAGSISHWDWDLMGFTGYLRRSPTPTHFFGFWFNLNTRVVVPILGNDGPLDLGVGGLLGQTFACGTQSAVCKQELFLIHHPLPPTPFLWEETSFHQGDNIKYAGKKRSRYGFSTRWGTGYKPAHREGDTRSLTPGEFWPGLAFSS